MKMPLAWHEECLRNREDHYLRSKAILLKMQDNLADALRQLNFSRDQLATAKVRGLEGYDADKFLVPRKKK
jgi:hypothetical protein